MLIHVSMRSPFVSGSLTLPVCLSSSVSHKQWLVSLRAVSLPFFPPSTVLICYKHQSYCRILRQVKISSYSHKREAKTITLRKDEWTAITCGGFMVIFCTQVRIRCLCSHLICYRWCWSTMQFSMNATCGCRLPSRSQTKAHYHKKLILSSLRFMHFVLITVAKCSLMCCGPIAIRRAAANQAVVWILTFELYFISPQICIMQTANRRAMHFWPTAHWLQSSQNFQVIHCILHCIIFSLSYCFITCY